MGDPVKTPLILNLGKFYSENYRKIRENGFNMGCPVCEGRLDGGRKASRDASDIEKNLKFTIEQNIVEINRLKALVDEANNKQKQEQFVRYHAGSFVVFALSNIYVRFSGFH